MEGLVEMEREERIFLSLSQFAMFSKLDEKKDLTGCDWEKIFWLCSNNKLIANTYDYIKNISEIPTEIKAKWDQMRMMTFINQKKSFHSLKNLLERANEQNIPYVLFKGEIISNLYSNPYYRISADSDIFVEEKDWERMSNLMLSQGYEYVEEKSKSTKVSSFYNKKSAHLIELHTSLYEDYAGQQIDLLNSMNLTDERNRVKINMEGVDFYTLGHEEHLIFQIFHVVKHFMLEGVCIRYLIDISLFINKYIDEINWDSFWDKVQKLKYDSFCIKFFHLCEKYYGLNPKVMDGKDAKMSKEDEEELLLDFIYKGKRFQNSKEGWQLLDDMRAYLEGAKTQVESLSWLEKKRKLLFPSQSELQKYYGYAKKHKILVPIAWIHRIFHSAKQHNENKELYGVMERRKAIEYRERMIDKIGLVENEK